MICFNQLNLRFSFYFLYFVAFYIPRNRSFEFFAGNSKSTKLQQNVTIKCVAEPVEKTGKLENVFLQFCSSKNSVLMAVFLSKEYTTSVKRNANIAKLQAGYLFPEVQNEEFTFSLLSRSI